MTTMTMMTMTMTMMTTITMLARMLINSLIDEVDDAGSRVGIARTVHLPGTGKNRYLAGRGCTPGDPTWEGHSI
jgi:hypothetical protein